MLVHKIFVVLEEFQSFVLKPLMYPGCVHGGYRHVKDRGLVDTGIFYMLD